MPFSKLKEDYEQKSIVSKVGLFPNYTMAQSHVHLDMKSFHKLPKNMENLPDMIQVLCNSHIHQELDVFVSARIYKPMMLMLIANYIEQKATEEGNDYWLDYKCYSSFEVSEIIPLPQSIISTSREEEEDESPKSSNETNIEEDYLPMSVHGREIISLGIELQQNIEAWCRLCMKEFYHTHKRPHHRHMKRRRIFRRSLIIDFETMFIEHKIETKRVGHCIVLGLEAGGSDGAFKLFIFDYREKEYLFSVHDQIFACMHTAVVHNEYSWICGVHAFNVRHEFVLLHGRMHYGNDCMMCMTLAFRVCMYLSFVKSVFDIVESKAGFHRDKQVFKNNIFTMLNRLIHAPKIKNGSDLVLQSPYMVLPLHEVSSKHCYLLTVPTKKIEDVHIISAALDMWGVQNQAVASLHFVGLNVKTGEIIEEDIFKIKSLK